MSFKIIAALATLILACGLALGGARVLAGPAPAAGTSNGAALFVGSASNSAVLIQWTRSGSRVSGTFDQALITGSETESVDSTVGPMTGTIAGSGITLSLTGQDTNLTGTLDGSGLELTFPGTNSGVTTIALTTGTADDFNQQVDSLQNQVNATNVAVQAAAQPPNADGSGNGEPAGYYGG
jgi:hypothetical protein